MSYNQNRKKAFSGKQKPKLRATPGLTVPGWGKLPSTDANYVMNDIACRNMANEIAKEVFRDEAAKSIWLKDKHSLEELIYMNLKKNQWNRLGEPNPKLRETV